MNALVQAAAPYRWFADALIAYGVDALAVGLLTCVAIAIVLRSWRRLDASARYAVWYAALIVVATGPLTIVGLQQRTGLGAMISISFQPFHTASSFGALSPVDPVGVAGGGAIALPELLGLGLVAAWFVVVAAGLARVVAGAVVLARLKRDALPIAPDLRVAYPLWRACADAAAARGVRLCVSDRVDVPLAVGLFDAMVLIPRHVIDAFEASDVDRFVLHELTHLERRDDWTALLARLAQTLQFFNPAVHVIARHLDLEREIACDDRVVATTHDVRSYATGLTRMAETTAWPHAGLATPAIFVTRKQLSLRVEQLLASRSVRERRRPLAAALIGFAASAAMVAAVMPFAPSFALGAETKSPLGGADLLYIEQDRGRLVPGEKRRVVYIRGDVEKVENSWTTTPTREQIERFIRSIEAQHKP
ncbi:MAG TPA: M56 family metallopeptidase [Candidatus Elarobacter sp.]|nr:M56 family metallopeptidase [Candidatus Elarobacter sp.]